MSTGGGITAHGPHPDISRMSDEQFDAWIDAGAATETVNCKVTGCTEEAKTRTGRHAYLCADHARKHSDETRAQYRANGLQRSGGALTAAAAELVPKTREFERVYEKAVATNQRAAEKLVDLRRAIHAFQATIRLYVDQEGQL